MQMGKYLLKDLDSDISGLTHKSYETARLLVERKGDDIFIPRQEHYEIETFIDGSIMTIADAIWPGLTPDLLSIILVTATQAKGAILIHQKMFESRNVSRHWKLIWEYLLLE